MFEYRCESADMSRAAIGALEGKTPLFSVCVPVYNAESYLREACASIFLQNVADYEVILVDDGSTDGSGEMCDAIAAEYNHVSVIHQENMGLLCARRAAIKRARGSYIVALDADDLLRPDALELLSKVVKFCEPDFVLFPFSRSTDFEVFQSSRASLRQGYYGDEGCREFRRSVFLGKHTSVWCKCVRRSILDADADYSAYRGLTYAEDLLQLPELMESARNFYYLDEPLYYYRDNDESCTRTYKPEYLASLSAALDVQTRYALRLGGDYPELARQSAMNHVGVLMGVLSRSSVRRGDATGELAAIRRYANEAGLFEPMVNGLSLRRAVEARLLEKRKYRLLLFVLRLHDAVKRFLKHR